MVMGAYKFVRSTGARTVRTVLRTTRCGGTKLISTIVIANYLTRECGSRVVGRVPRISTIINVNTGSSVIGVYRGTLYNIAAGVFPGGYCLPLSSRELVTGNSR